MDEKFKTEAARCAAFEKTLLSLKDSGRPFDLHMHTCFCDGENTPEEMVLSAIEKGLGAVGLCGHSYTAFDESYCLSKEGKRRFMDEVNSLKEKYKDRITVLLGVEQDFFSDDATDGFDYVIGSVHCVNAGGAYVYVDWSEKILRDGCETYFGGDVYALCERYFETVADVAEKTRCDIIGHFDLVSKFNEPKARLLSSASLEKGGEISAAEKLFDEHHPRYVAAWKKAADRLLSCHIPFEINTGAMSRGYKSTPYPSGEMISYIKSRGGDFILSSDAHRKDHIAYRFDEVGALPTRP